MPKQHRGQKGKIKTSDVQKQVSPQPLMIAAYVTITLHFLFLFVFPKISPAMTFHRTWGFHFIGYFSAPVIILFYITALFVANPNFAKKIIAFWENVVWKFILKTPRIGKYPLFILVSILSFFLFYKFRSKYGLLGDNFLRVQDVTTGKIVKIEWGNSHIYQLIYKVFNSNFGLTAKDSMVLFNCLTGPLYVFLSFCIADVLGKNSMQKGVFWAGMMLIAIIQYFFGYIETYNFITILIVLFLFTGILVSRNKLNVIIPGIIVIIAFFSHLMVVVFIPAFLYLFYRKVLCRWKSFTQPSFILAEAIASIPVLIFIYIKFVRGNNLIFTPNAEYSYAMLTWTHVWEYINGQILAAPMAFFMFVVLLWNYIKHRNFTDLTGQFVAVAAFFTTFNAFIFNAVRGAADWDVVCMAGLPITLTALYLLFNTEQIPFIRVNLKYICLLFIFFSALNTVPWIVVNATDRSIARKEDITKNDPGEYYVGHSPEMVLSIEFNTNNIDDRAEYWYRQGTIKYPGDPRNFFNLATFLYSHKKTEEATQILEMLMNKFPAYPNQYGVALQVFSSLGKNQLIIKALQNIVKIDNANQQILQPYYSPKQLLTFRAQLASVYINNKQWKEAYDQLTRVVTQGGQQITIDGKSLAELLKEVEQKLNKK